MSLADEARALLARTVGPQGLAPQVDPVVLKRVASILVSPKVPDDAATNDDVVVPLREREAAICEVIPLSRTRPRARSSP